jgi:hypothetical protein
VRQNGDYTMTDVELKGKVSAIDVQKRQLTMKDELGVLHIYQWTAELDVVMQKWKPGYYLDLNYDADTYIIKAAKYWQEGKDVFPKDTKPYQKPRNERLIVVQVLIKAYTDLVFMSFNPEDVDFDIARKLVLKAVEEDIDRVMEIGAEQK